METLHEEEDTNENISKTLTNSSYENGRKSKQIRKKQQFDYQFKIVLIGDSGVGKSCVLLRFSDDKFNDNFYTTIGVDFRFKTLDLENKSVKYEIVKF